MTLTSFFAMFFMGNTSLYNQLVVRDMVSSNSLNSLLSTLVYILAFTLVIEGIGMLAIWGDIHGTMGMDLQEELAFPLFMPFPLSAMRDSPRCPEIWAIRW